MKLTNTKKFRHGSISLALTVVVIAAVILINAIFGALSEKFLWYIDMTPEPRFTLSEEAKGYLNQMDTAKEATILLCDEKFAWESNTIQLEVLKTALDIEKEYPNVKVKYTDIYTNPSSVNAYKESSGKNITTQSVIVTCENSAPRVYNIEDFFKLDENGYVAGYNGEDVLVAALLAVTRASEPVVCLTTNHGESYDQEFADLLTRLGFKVQPINLLAEDIPADCRLLVISDPVSDFLEKDGVSEISEIDKLEVYLEGSNSMMVLVDKDTPYLPHLEQFLAEWGIEIARTDKNENTVIKETKPNSLSSNGYTNKAVYVEGGMGGDVTAHMRESTVPKTVAFPNTTALRISSIYQKTLFEDYVCGEYYVNSASRTCYNVFTSSAEAVAIANGEEVMHATEQDPFAYMMLSYQSHDSADGMSTSKSFVFVSASTDFAASTALDSRYGNASVLSYACNTMGSLVVPVALDCKYYASMEIASMTAGGATAVTVIFAVVPTSVVFIAGIYVMIRRKHA